MSSLHKEIEFENDICNHLATYGWLYKEGDAQRYDRPRALFPDDVIAWVQEAQPKAWESLTKTHGEAAEEALLTRLRKQLDDRGTLDVLRNGIEMIGLRQPLQLVQFKPSLAMNSELQIKYEANRLRVVRQVHYSVHYENSIDLVLFVNGIPVATAELKCDLTQAVRNAIDQYRFDRDPKPQGKSAEPLLTFMSGALVHFAVSNTEVYMTTKLQGPHTVFLPFNQGDNGAAGNPVNEFGHRTAYLWESIWQRDSWLEILGRYIVTRKDSKKRIEGIIFPRYHQLDATRKLVADVKKNGPGQKYLIQHSAGSGKTNSIAWTAHFLADLHTPDQKKIFDSVLVVSDRTVLDSQLQEAIFEFERTSGVVATITGKGQSKSGELANALSGGKKIVVCTIQTFPHALKAVQQLAATEGKSFAVIADEAHSSQTGEAASKLKQLLSAEELQELSDGGEISTEDLLAVQMATRASTEGITYIAFTATPKAKTMELFGTLPNPELPPGPQNLPIPFHVYSMRQAIEEGFILDVLKNYTSYRLAFKLASGGRDWDEQEVERGEALKGIMRWVRLHPYNISQKVQVVVEHFRENVATLLNGHAKAMVVVASRLEAVRWQLAIKKYIKERGYKMDTLVAFSGEVMDKESNDDPLTEMSKVLNPYLKSPDIREAFKSDTYQILLVANKFQTGFDQPLLCGMYIDKRLAGIQAVQTLSRLNRSYNGEYGKKDTTYILDFVNDTEEILQAFKQYYETAELAGVTDPDIIFNLRAKLDATGYYDDNEVERVVQAEYRSNPSQAELIAAIEPVADRLLKKYKTADGAVAITRANGDARTEQAARDEMNALLLFKRNMGTYLRIYSFLSQIFDYGNTAIEKRALFYKRLIPLLEFGREREGVDLSQVELTHHRLVNKGKRNLSLNEGEPVTLKPITEAGEGELREKEKALLQEIIERLNEVFQGELTDDDKLVYVNQVLKTKLLESEVLVQQAANNTKEQFANSPDLSGEFMNAVMDAFEAHTLMSKQVLESESVQKTLLEILLGPAKLYEALKERSIYQEIDTE